jgi:IS605 OrfB family transposase
MTKRKKKAKDKIKLKYKKDNKKKFLNKKLEILKNSINNYSKNVPLYNIFFENSKNIETYSFYDMYLYNIEKNDNNKYEFNYDEVEIPKKIYKCTKVCLKPTNEQKINLLDMMEGYRLVYNLTVNFINRREYLRKKSEKENSSENKIKIKKQPKKKQCKNKEVCNILNDIISIISEKEDIEERKLKRVQKINDFLFPNNFEMITDYKILRTYFLKEQIDEISKIYKTPIHILNKAVSLACASFKSALTNLKEENIKFFKIRPIKKTKNSLIMDIEKQYFTKDGKGFISTILGKEMLNKNNIKYNIKCDCKLHYNKDTKKFILLIPQEVKSILCNSDKYISIDPGLRTFLNCKTNNSYIEIGKNVRDNLEKLILKSDKLMKIKKNKIKNRYLKIIRTKIKNRINDMHWKIINYLTNTYKTIIIGKWSTKSIISKNDSFFDSVNKRVIQNLSFYSFLEKLKYKCMIKNIDLKIVEEYYTSKVCSVCGNIKNNLKGDKIYKCLKCKTIMNRDYNGCRNIFLKSIKSVI